METFFGQVHFPTPRHCHFWKEVLVFVYVCPLHWPLPFLVIYDMGINWKLILSTFPWYIWWDHLMASSAVAFFENIVLPFLEGGWGVCTCYEMGIQVPNKESKLGCHFWKVGRVFVHALTHISLFGKSCQKPISLRYPQIDFQGQISWKGNAYIISGSINL